MALLVDAGSEVSGLIAGDVVVAPFVWAANTCDFCREGLLPPARFIWPEKAHSPGTSARRPRLQIV